MNDSREHILNASLKLFLQKSFKEVTMKEIVEETGLSKGAFYHYFSSKEQVFEEVMDYFFSDLLEDDYTLFSQDSLHSFYNDFLSSMIKKSFTVKNMSKDKETFNANHYFLLFDAMKLLPDFKKKHQDQNEQELKIWAKVISNAQKSGEIKAEIQSSKIAKLFIYSSYGIGIHSIMSNNIDKGIKETKTLWDVLYNSFKK